jgi:hypothetical protein
MSWLENMFSINNQQRREFELAWELIKEAALLV